MANSDDWVQASIACKTCGCVFLSCYDFCPLCHNPWWCEFERVTVASRPFPVKWITKTIDIVASGGKKPRGY